MHLNSLEKLDMWKNVRNFISKIYTNCLFKPSGGFITTYGSLR